MDMEVAAVVEGRRSKNGRKEKRCGNMCILSVIDKKEWKGSWKGVGR